MVQLTQIVEVRVLILNQMSIGVLTDLVKTCIVALIDFGKYNAVIGLGEYSMHLLT